MLGLHWDNGNKMETTVMGYMRIIGYILGYMVVLLSGGTSNADLNVRSSSF